MWRRRRSAGKKGFLGTFSMEEEFHDERDEKKGSYDSLFLLAGVGKGGDPFCEKNIEKGLDTGTKILSFL